MRKVAAFWGLLWMAGLPTGAESQEQPSSDAFASLDSIMNLSVSAASLYDQSRTEAPGQVTIVTADEIEGFGHRSLAEILQSVGGFNMSSDLQYAYAGVRGFGRPGDVNHRILFLVDGHTLNESILGAVPVGNAFPIGVRAMERVEVVRGPGSPLYGTRAMLAVVNVITKKGRDLGRARASVESGEYGTYGASLSGGGETNSGLEYSAFGSWHDTDGQDFYFPEFDAPATGNGVSRGMAGESSARGSGNARFRGASIAMGVSRREKSIPTAPYGTTFNDPRASTEDHQEFLEVGYERQWRPELLVDARLYHDHYKNAGQYPYAMGLMQATFESRMTGGEAHLRWDPTPNHRVIFGGEVQRAQTATFEQAFVSGPTVFAGEFPYWVFSAFAQDEVQLTRELALTLGVRHDRYREEDRSTTNPRAALVYHPSENTTLKAMFGTSFRNANVYERQLNSPGVHLPNPGLVPETIRTTEVGFEQRLGRSLALQLGVYENRMDQIIELSPVVGPTGPILQFQNLSSVTARGVETELSTSFSDIMRGYARYAYQRAKDDATDQPISNFPSHTLKVGALIGVRNIARVGLDGVFESGRMTLAGYDLDSFFVTNATVSSRPIRGRLVLVGSLKNVFDTRYALPGGFHHLQEALTQEGRRLYAGLQITP